MNEPSLERILKLVHAGELRMRSDDLAKDRVRYTLEHIPTESYAWGQAETSREALTIACLNLQMLVPTFWDRIVAEENE